MAAIEIRWNKMGTEFTYKVLYAKNEAGPWLKHHDFRLADEIVDTLRGGVDQSGSAPYQVYENNVYEIDELEEDTTYYVKVLCNDKYHQWWYSYEYPGSLGGGTSEPHKRPSPNNKNIIGFQFNVVI